MGDFSRHSGQHVPSIDGRISFQVDSEEVEKKISVDAHDFPVELPVLRRF